jgi:hypothetical protein
VRYADALQRGSSIINRNWQLVLIQVGAMFASFVGFFVVVGIPLAIAFIVFGLDLTGLSRFEDVFRTFREPSEILSKYFALVLLVLTSLVLYVTAVLAVGIFLFGGAIGIIAKSLAGIPEKFHIKLFLSEGKRLFFPLVGFTSLVGLIFILVAFVLGLCGGLISAVVSVAREQEATLALFLGFFFSLILFAIGFTLIMITLSVTAYGSAVMAVRGQGPVNSLKESVRYLYGHSHAFYLYCLLFLGYLLISFMVVSVSYPLGMIPIIGSFLALIYHFGVYIIQSYLGLVLIATLFCYYASTTMTAEGQSVPGTTPQGDSGEESGTSGPQAPGPDEVPPEKDPSSES